MACYRPLGLVDTGQVNPDTGKKVMSFVGSIKTLIDIDSPDRDNFFIVPCNRCIGCRLDYARQWSNRMLLEMADNPDGIFVTMTYNNENVPYSEKGYMSTSVRDCQLFFKRLRKHFKGKKIRYFLGAEYGPKNNRPHYHAIIFGLSLRDFDDLSFYKYNRLRDSLFISKTFADIWQKGFCTLGSVSRDSCAYVARYMLKKLKGFDKLDYELKGIEKEFSLCSRRPGIGLGYFDKHSISNEISVFDGTSTVTFPIPSKLLNKVLEIDSDQYYVLKALRRECATASTYMEFVNSDLQFLEYLGMKETETWKKIKGISSGTRLDI